ncbi:MAG: phasin family protein [Pseudomonadota bacterium]
MQSTSVLNPIVDMYQTQLEASRQFADAMFSGTEKIDRVIIDATHRAVSDQLRFAQALAAARDPKGLASLQPSLIHRPENAVNYQKEIMRVFAEMQNDLGKSMQQYVEQLTTKTTSSATRPLETAQEQAKDAMLNPMTGMFSVWESAFREVAALANKNMVAARSTFENAANAVGNAATSTVESVEHIDEEASAEHRKSTSAHRRK